jgi:uncharacterized protein YecA (UPF0149 family)
MSLITSELSDEQADLFYCICYEDCTPQARSRMLRIYTAQLMETKMDLADDAEDTVQSIRYSLTDNERLSMVQTW